MDHSAASRIGSRAGKRDIRRGCASNARPRTAITHRMSCPEVGGICFIVTLTIFRLGTVNCSETIRVREIFNPKTSLHRANYTSLSPGPTAPIPGAEGAGRELLRFQGVPMRRCARAWCRESEEIRYSQQEAFPGDPIPRHMINEDTLARLRERVAAKLRGEGRRAAAAGKGPCPSSPPHP